MLELVDKHAADLWLKREAFEDFLSRDNAKHFGLLTPMEQRRTLTARTLELHGSEIDDGEDTVEVGDLSGFAVRGVAETMLRCMEKSPAPANALAKVTTALIECRSV